MQFITIYIKVLFNCTPSKSSNLLSAQFVWKLPLSCQLSNSSEHCILQYKNGHLLCSVIKKPLTDTKCYLSLNIARHVFMSFTIYLKIAFQMYAFKQ